MFCKYAMRICFLSALAYAACVNPSGDDAATDESTPLREMTDHNPKNPNARYLAVAQGETEGKLIKGSVIQFSMIQEYDSLKQLLNETRRSNTMKVVQHYNAERDMTRLETYNNDVPSIWQENTYNDRGHLLREFRIEQDGERPDTILYEYHYKYSADSLSYVAFRTNNGDTVTRFTWEKKLNRIYKTEEAYPYRGFTILTKQDITTNDAGKPVSLREERISNDSENDPLDTTVSSSTYVYDDTGRLSEERNENDIFKAAHIRYKYSNGIVSEMIVDGKPIAFEHFVIAK